MKVMVVCGDREFNDKKHVYNALENFPEDIQEIVFMAAKGGSGSDSTNELARQWAEEGGVITTPFMIDWNNVNVPGAEVATGKFGKYNKRAAIHCKEQMMDYCDGMVVINDSFEHRKFDEDGKFVYLYKVDDNRSDDEYDIDFWSL